MVARFTSRAVVLACAALLSSRLASAEGLKVDINAVSDRREAISKHCENWNFADAPEQSQAFGDVKVTIRASGGGTIRGVLWKGGFEYGAIVGCDGIVLEGVGPGAPAEAARGGNAMQIVIAGLKPGKHTLTTFHNAVDNNATPALLRVHAGAPDRGVIVRPGVRNLQDADLPSAHIEIEANDKGEAIVLVTRADGSDLPIVLNAIAVDQPNPKLTAALPSPEWGDEHAPKSPTFRWRSPEESVSFDVYIGESREAVASATPASKEFAGKVTSSAFASTQTFSIFKTYYWRVDTLDTKNVVTPSPVWDFRPQQIAFPGAEGYGRFAIGGRGGKVITVTSLEDAGPGTLREAVETNGPRTIVFAVGGAIFLKSKLIIRNPYMTIAGQTAPGDGIAVYGWTFGHIGSHDNIIRYMRIRVGDQFSRGLDGTGFPTTDHAIMDHCSVSWTMDEAVSSRAGKNITFQRNIVSEALNPAGHGFAGSISGKVGSFHHNLMAHCAGRNWSLAGGYDQDVRFAGFLDIRNNVCYNWVHRTTDGGVRKLNFVGNYYIPGPASQPEIKHFVIARIENRRPTDIQEFHVAGNMMEGHPEYDADNWANGGVLYDQKDYAAVKMMEPFCPSYITEHTPKAAYDSVMADVGANLPKYDAVDTRVLNDVRKRSFTLRGSRNNLPGIPDTIADVGGYPEMKSGPAPEDKDKDGMADTWELARGLNPADPEDRNADPNNNGYTNLEEYLNWIVENGGLQAKK